MTAGRKAFRRTHGAELFGSRELDDLVEGPVEASVS